MKEINEERLAALRESVMQGMSPKRFAHTLAVEEMIVRLCALFCSEHTAQMRAAALLHDVTKELGTDEQVALCRKYGLCVSDADMASPKTFHARTAAAKIECEMPAFNDSLIVNAVRWHTTGHADMTLTEKLLYLADYIDASRTFESCVMLRNFFFDAQPEKLSDADRKELLRKTLILSYDMTVKDLLESGKTVAVDTVEARNALILEGKRS